MVKTYGRETVPCFWGGSRMKHRESTADLCWLQAGNRRFQRTNFLYTINGKAL